MYKATIVPDSRAVGPSAMQDLNDLYLFALVVEQGSFTVAGKAAGLTTSRISRRIAGLEERLGVRLLHRTTRKLALTDIGEMYYQHCQAMVSEAEAAAEVVEQIQASPRGRVRITCPVLAAESVLGSIITDFMRAYPEVRVSLTATDRFVDLIDEGIDVAIRFRAAPLENSSLVARSLGESRTTWWRVRRFSTCMVGPHSPLIYRAWSASVSAATTLPIPGIWPVRTGRPPSSRFIPLLESDDWLVIKQAALAALGMAAIPDELCHQEIAADKLEIVLPAWRLPSTNLHIIYTSRRGLIPAVRTFIDFASERLAAICLTDAKNA